jgi:alanyl-tRNA synthetase
MSDGQETTFTQADIDNLKAEHEKAIKELNDRHNSELSRKVDAAIKKAQAEAEEAAKKANMSELEKANAELAEYKTKYQEQADINTLTSQKEETRKIMAEMKIDADCLDYVFIPKDSEGTKARCKSFKDYIDKVKKETFESNVKSTVPGAGGGGNTEDAALRKAMGLSPVK